MVPLPDLGWNEVAVSHDDLVHDSLGAVLRRELALLDGAFDEVVLSLIGAQRLLDRYSPSEKLVPVWSPTGSWSWRCGDGSTVVKKHETELHFLGVILAQHFLAEQTAAVDLSKPGTATTDPVREPLRPAATNYGNNENTVRRALVATKTFPFATSAADHFAAKSRASRDPAAWLLVYNSVARLVAS